MREDIPIQMTITVEQEVPIEITLYDIIYALTHQCTNKERWAHTYNILRNLRLDKTGLNEPEVEKVIQFLETKIEEFKKV